MHYNFTFPYRSTSSETRKHQCSFSYVPKTKTPSTQPKIKMGGTYKYFKAGKGNKSSERALGGYMNITHGDTSSLNKTGLKFSSRNSKQNTNSDTITSIRTNRSK